MKDQKDIIVFKKSIFTTILNKIKEIFRLNKEIETIHEKVMPINDYKGSIEKQKGEFIGNLKIEEDSTGIIYLKMKLENHEIRAIDLTDEQINKLQEIYDKEIQEKKNKIKKLKSA